MILKILFTYALIINIFSFVLFGVDKWRAKNGRWRIPESTLFAIAFLGGSVGAYLGMSVWRHKTKHKKFTIGIPFLILVHIALVWLIFGVEIQ